MKVLAICDSEYGNTWKIAEAMADALRPYAEEVEMVRAIDVHGLLPAGYDMLLLGGPTQGHGVSPRLTAVLHALPEATVRGVPVLAFDTRLHMMKLLTGSGADGTARTLKSLGANLLLPPESFFVKGTEGPLEEGEIERAVEWVRSPNVLGVLQAAVSAP